MSICSCYVLMLSYNSLIVHICSYVFSVCFYVQSLYFRFWTEMGDLGPGNNIMYQVVCAESKKALQHGRVWLVPAASLDAAAGTVLSDTGRVMIPLQWRYMQLVQRGAEPT